MAHSWAISLALRNDLKPAAVNGGYYGACWVLRNESETVDHLNGTKLLYPLAGMKGRN